jgi:hypothetical protein
VSRVLLASTSIYLQGPEPPGEASLDTAFFFAVGETHGGFVDVYAVSLQAFPPTEREQIRRGHAARAAAVDMQLARLQARRQLRRARAAARMARTRQRRSTRTAARTTRQVRGKKRRRRRSSDDPDLASAQSEPAHACAAHAAGAGSGASRAQDAASRSASRARNNSSRHIRALTDRRSHHHPDKSSWRLTGCSNTSPEVAMCCHHRVEAQRRVVGVMTMLREGNGRSMTGRPFEFVCSTSKRGCRL